jgi:hypothetical protein
MNDYHCLVLVGVPLLVWIGHVVGKPIEICVDIKEFTTMDFLEKFRSVQFRSVEISQISCDVKNKYYKASFSYSKQHG